MVALATDTVRALNDRLRQHHSGGSVVVTRGLQALDANTLAQVLTAVAEFDSFDESNDPYGEHDFGSVDVQGNTIFFKIDAYNCDLRWHSPAPTGPELTRRVMTIMLAEEY